MGNNMLNKDKREELQNNCHFTK